VRFLAHGLERHVHRRDVVVREVHRHLRLPIVLDVPTRGLALLEAPLGPQRRAVFAKDLVAARVTLQASSLSDLERDLVRELGVARVEVDVVGDEELAGADHEGAGPGLELRRTEVRLPRGVLELLRQPLVLARSNVR
jgi:hypothetical protein